MSEEKDVDDEYFENVARWIVEAADRMRAAGYRRSDCRSITKAFLSTITPSLTPGIIHPREEYKGE